MPPLAFLLVALAAVLHVTWNILIKSSGDPLRASTAGMVTGAFILIPAALVGWFLVGQPAIPAEAFILGTVSGLLEALYFVLLSAAYRRGDLSVVYPIARGTAPLLAVLIGVLVLREALSPVGWLGVALLLGGLLVLQRPWQVVRRAAGSSLGQSAVPFALATGVTIAAYSAVDRVGTRLIAPWLYAAILWLVSAVALVVWVGLSGRGEEWQLDLRRAAVGGVLTLFAYLLVLGAFSIAPLAAVAPLRESAIVLASAWGVLRLREAATRREATVRLGAAVLVLVGAALLALAG